MAETLQDRLAAAIEYHQANADNFEDNIGNVLDIETDRLVLAKRRKHIEAMREALDRLSTPASVSEEAAADDLYVAFQEILCGCQPEWMMTADWGAIIDALVKESLTAASTGGEGWQPIETAPKSRKVIAGYYNECGKWRSVMACYYKAKTLDANHDYIDGDEDGYAPEGWYEDGEAYSDALLPTDCSPTHWMPLPAPLTIRTQKDGE